VTDGQTDSQTDRQTERRPDDGKDARSILLSRVKTVELFGIVRTLSIAKVDAQRIIATIVQRLGFVRDIYGAV